MDNSLSQPFEVKSFEGGITDFFLQAPNSYMERGENFIVNNDLKLEVRWGSFLWDNLRNNHILDSSNPRRIDNFLLFRDESILLAHSGRDVYYQDFTSGIWTRLVGPSGNEVYSEGGYYSFATQLQWNGHLFTTSSAASLPSKIYLDESNTIQVRSVGLPKVKNAKNDNNTTTLAACITLANELRTSMLSHFSDASYDNGSLANTLAAFLTPPPNSGTALHFVKDKSASTYLSTPTGTIAPPAPSPLPTPAPAATDLASLYTLTVALCKAQAAHMLDANTVGSGDITTGQVHFMNRSRVATQSAISGPNSPITNTQAPTTLEEARVRLNLLRKLWTWHILAVNTHIWTSLYNGVRGWVYGAVTDYNLLNRYSLLTPEVPNPSSDGTPVITANYSKFIGYVNSLKYLYNGHTSNGYYASRSASAATSGNYFSDVSVTPPHTRNPGMTLYELSQIATLDALKCELPDATTFDDACLTLYWIRALYSLHYTDAALTNSGTAFSCTSTAGSANITNVLDANGAALTLPIGLSLSIVSSYVDLGSLNATGPAGENSGAVVLASASGTATLSKPCNFSLSNVSPSTNPSIYGVSSRFHYVTGGNFASVPTTNNSAIVSSDEALASPTQIGLDIASWVDLATEFYTAITSHTANFKIHYSVTSLSTLSPLYTSIPLDTLSPAVGSYIYALIYKLTYKTVDGVEFVEYSNPVQISANGYPVNYPIGYTPTDLTYNFVTTSISATNVAQYGTVITGIPVLANDSKSNYDLTKIQIQIFRTIDTGTTFYLLDTIANGVTSYTDTTNDTLADTGKLPLNTRETIYTTGGVVGFDPPPRSRFVHILQNTAIYGATYDGDQYFPNRLLQSIPGTPAATNLTFYDDLDEAVTGLSSTGGNFIAFTSTKTYRLAGGYNELGQGNLSHERISDNVGCIGEGSIVQTDVGIYFAGNDGFYFTDGYAVTKVSAHLDKTYQKYTQSQNQRDRIVGTYDRQFRRVSWTMQANPTATDCGHLFVLHTGYSETRSSGVFTAWSNGVNFMPSAVTYYKNQLVRGDYRGVLYYHSTYSKTDPTVPSDLTVAATAWNTSYLPYDYKSAAFDFNTTFKGQWATRIHVAGKNVGNAGVQVSTVREIDNQNAKQFSPIFYDENLIWGDASLTWGDASILWEYDKTLDEWRRFPTKSLRSQFRQIQMKPALIITNKYDDYPDGSFATVVSDVANVATVSIVTPAGFSAITWPLNVVGQTVSFDVDAYTNSYTITGLAGGSTQLVIADPTSALVGLPTNMKWQISGYLKEQRFQISSYDIHFGYMGQRGQANTTNQGGGNG